MAEIGCREAVEWGPGTEGAFTDPITQGDRSSRNTELGLGGGVGVLGGLGGIGGVGEGSRVDEPIYMLRGTRGETKKTSRMSPNLDLPLVDLSSTDRASAAKLVRQACVDFGFFYVINHGIEDSLLRRVFRQIQEFFALPLEDKMELERNDEHRGYTPFYAEILDPTSKFRGDPKESFYIGPKGSKIAENDFNQWPSEAHCTFSGKELVECLPFWRETMETYYEEILNVGKRVLSLIALALNLDDQLFEKIGALYSPMGFIRLLHYPGQVATSDSGLCGASAHSDYGMVTLLVTDGVPGLQICREKDKNPQFWEDVHHIDGALIINIGDMLERWTNCFFRSTLHRVVSIGQERYSAAFFLDPPYDCVVECLESCCSETSPARFPPIKSGDYLEERLRLTYSSK